MDWYVISENEHLGPFKEEVLEDLIKSGKVQEDTMLWREGMNDPASYRDLFMEDVPPAIPTEALAPKPKTIKLKQAPKESAKAEKAQPSPFEVPKAETKNSNVVVEEAVEEEQLQEHVEKSSKKKGSLVKWLVLVLILGALGAAGWFYIKSKEINFVRPAKMTISDHTKLLNAARAQSAEPEFSWAISQDKTTLWMAMNKTGEGEVTIKLASSPGMILSEENIIAKSTGVFKNGIAEFENFNFEQGQKIIDGRYLIEIKSTSIQPPLIQRLTGAKAISLSHQDIALLSSMNEAVFTKALKNFKERRDENAEGFLEDLEQKYRTVKAISLNIKESMEKSFSAQTGSWSERVDQFENEYKSNFGNFFTNFVIQNEKAYSEIEDKDFPDKVEIISDYTRLTRIAKRLGEDTMSALEQMREFKTPKDETAMTELKNNVYAPFDKMIEEIDSKLQVLDSKKSN